MQCAARGLAGKIICGNSLSLEVFNSAYTSAAPQFLNMNGDPFAQQNERVTEARENTAEQQDRLAEIIAEPAVAGVQLSLF